MGIDDLNNPNELQDQRTFEELINVVTSGATISPATFHQLLMEGVSHFQRKGQEKGPFSGFFLQKADEYSKALSGNREAKVHFCEREADYIDQLAKQFEGEYHDANEAEKLRKTADCWRAIPLNLPLTG